MSYSLVFLETFIPVNRVKGVTLVIESKAVTVSKGVIRIIESKGCIEMHCIMSAGSSTWQPIRGTQWPIQLMFLPILHMGFQSEGHTHTTLEFASGASLILEI